MPSMIVNVFLFVISYERHLLLILPNIRSVLTMICLILCFDHSTTENLHMIPIQKLKVVCIKCLNDIRNLKFKQSTNLTSDIMKLLPWSTSRKEMTLQLKHLIKEAQSLCGTDNFTLTKRTNKLTNLIII